MELEAVLNGTLPPIVAALVLVSIAGVRLLPLAMAIGLFVAYGLVKGQWLDLPHVLWAEPQGQAWLLWSVIGCGVVALLEHLRVLPSRIAGAAGAAAAAFGVFLMLSKLAERWSVADALLYVGVGGIAAGATVLACRRVIVQAPSGLPSAIVFVMLLSLDAVFLVADAQIALLAQMCGAVAAALGAGAGTHVWRRPFVPTIAEGTWIGGAHALFVLSGTHLGRVPATAAGWGATVCALFAPCALLLLPASAHRPARWTVLALIAIAVPMAAAVLLAWPEPSGY